MDGMSYFMIDSVELPDPGWGILIMVPWLGAVMISFLFYIRSFPKISACNSSSSISSSAERFFEGIDADDDGLGDAPLDKRRDLLTFLSIIT